MKSTIARRAQSGFTLIELIMVIVIIGILAAVAIPKFGNLTSDAEKAASDGFFGAAKSACITAFAGHRAANATSGFITTGALLKGAMQGDTADWTAADKTLSRDASGTTHTITIETDEDATQPCALTKNW